MIASLLVIPAKPLPEQPFPDSPEYADSANRLAHGEGYTTAVIDKPTHPTPPNPPRYPPGYPLLLAPFSLAGHFPQNVQWGAKILTLALVLVTGWAALDLAGPFAAGLAILVVGLSPFTRNGSQLVLADPLVASLAVAVLPLLLRGTRSAIRGAGFLSGFSVVVSLSSVTVLGSLLLILRGRDRLRAAAAATPPIVGLAAYQWATFGRPWRTGYGYWLPHLHTFALSAVTTRTGPRDGPWVYPDQMHGALMNWACHPCRVGGAMHSLPNFMFYPAVLIGAFWIFAPPLVTLLGAVVALVNRHTLIGRFVGLATLTELALFLPYFHQAARFVAPATSMLIVLSSIVIPNIVQQVTARGSSPPPGSSGSRLKRCFQFSMTKSSLESL